MITDLTPGGHPTSGVERSSITLISALLEAGLEVEVLAPGNPGLAPEGYPFPVRRIEMNGRYQLLRGFRPWIASVSAALAGLRPDIVHGQGLLHDGIAAVAATGVASVVTAHGDPVADAHAHYPGPVAGAVTPLLSRTVAHIVDRASAIVDVTPDWRVNLPVEPRDFVHIPNPVEPCFFAEETPTARPRVLFFGGTRHIKGLDILLDAWPHVEATRPDASLELFGVDAGDPLLRRYAGIDSLTTHPGLDAGGVARTMQAGGVVVVPSRFEVAPLVIAEAWAAGIPVVATDVGGVRALSNDAALLCAPEADSLAAALLDSMTPDTSVRLVGAGRRRVEAHSPVSVARAHIELYERLTRSGQGVDA